VVSDLTNPSDTIQPFQVDGLSLSGRLVRMGDTVDRVLSQHDYPDTVSRMLGELMAMAAVLGAALKFEGRMTAETRGDGPIRLLAVDFMSDGQMRGYASFDAERLAQAEAAGGLAESPVPRLIGNGLLALTVDQGPETELYQGIVQLDGATLAECAHSYFQQSDQIDTALKLAVERKAEGWRAGAISMQRLAELGPGGQPVLSADREDNWRTAMALLGTATPSELTDAGLSDHTLLYRLFHEQGVRVFDSRRIAFGCNCSDERALAVLRRMPATEIEDLAIDGVLEVICQFCNRTQHFSPSDIMNPPEEEA
jgi:molecular chaperone Hsp33